MAKRRSRQRPFNRAVLDELAVPEFRLRMGPGETVWRYTITVPVEEIRPQKRQKATAVDLDNLTQAFVDHFGGCTALPNSTGLGLRDPTNPQQGPEVNVNSYFVVLSSPIPEADAYFRA